MVLVDLELRQIPALRRFDARRYVGKVADDMAPPDEHTHRPPGAG
jgi:hypothetical protein